MAISFLIYSGITLSLLSVNQLLHANAVSTISISAQTSTGTLTFNWANQSGGVAYIVALATGPNNADFAVPVASGTTPLGAATTTYTNLSANTSYFFRVKVSTDNDEPLANPPTSYVQISTYTLPILPTLAATTSTINSLSLNIGLGGGTSGQYNVELATNSNFNGAAGVRVHTATGVLPSGATTFGNLLSGATYYVRARALWNGDNNLGQNTSSFISITTATLPVLPTLSIVEVISTSITVSLTKGNNNNNSPYEISYSTNANFAAPVSTATRNLPSGNTAFVNLTQGTTYYFRARTLWNSAPSSDPLQNASEFVTISSRTTAPVTTAPSTPTALTVSAITATSITFGWSDNSNNEDGFKLLATTGGILATASAGATSLSLTGLSPNTQVQVSGIAAFNSVGASTFTASISSYTLANAPGTPSFVSVTRTEATISFSSNSNPTSVLYEVTQSTDNFIFQAGISTPIAFSANHTSTSATIGSLSAGGTYYFRVRARNSANVVTAFSASITTVTPAAEVIQSSGGTVDAGATTLTADPGVTITNTTLADGSTQQTLISTQTATVTYGSGIALQLPAGVECKVIASADSVQLTSTQTIPIVSAGLTIEATSGTVTLLNAADSVEVSLASSAPQNVLTTLPTTSTKTFAVSLNPAAGIALKTAIPPGAITQNVKLRVKKPDSFPLVSAAIKPQAAPGMLPSDLNSLSAAPSILSALGGEGIGLEITLDKKIQPSKTVNLSMTYRDSDLSGKDPNTLLLARFEETISKWVILPSSLDRNSKKVTGTTQHFSKFQLMSLAPASNVNEAKIYPNPLRRHLGQKEMVFTNISANASIKIYTYLGELVRELQADNTGTARWDGKNSSGEIVASGLYIALMEGAENSRKILRIAVEK